jgi:Rhodopirellula transposase DDE domain
MSNLEEVQKRYQSLGKNLNEKQRRYFAAAEANAIGRGGIKLVFLATGISRTTIIAGKKELASGISEPKRIRKKGGGRRKKESECPGLLDTLKNGIESATRGDPESSLRWVAKSLNNIARDLKEKGYTVSKTVIRRLLREMNYSLQANKKTIEGCKSPDRNAQFEHINEQSKKFMREQQPVVSIDTKKKELVGNFKNNGREYAPAGEPREVNAHDFQSDALLKAVPFGIYDIVKNQGWINLGISNDTAMFAVESIRRWWNGLGKASYPNAEKLMITADCGGSNGYRVRLFKKELQKFANESGLKIFVCHFPPGTSKWNKIEHRLFSFISNNWRAHPLNDLVTIVNLIGNTRTDAGLKVCCEIDDNNYETGIKITKKEVDALNIKRDEFHGEWNYSIWPEKFSL